MRSWLDFEFNAFEGELITMCLLREDNVAMYVGFRDNANVPLDPWVAENVVPHINKAPIQPKWLSNVEIQAALLKFFKGDKNIVIVTDWPDDVAYFSRLMLTGPGTMVGTKEEIPRITFEIERVDAYPTEVVGAVQHNAYWDAIALRHKLQFPNGMPATEVTSETSAQSTPMFYSPNNGTVLSSIRWAAKEFRRKWPDIAWLFNPWNGKRRPMEDVVEDPSGLMLNDEDVYPGTKSK